jgi:hypothetical protein
MKHKSITTSTIKIIKQNSSDEFPTDSASTVTSYIETDTNTTNMTGGNEARYTSITEAEYKRPRKGTKQENFTKDDIRERLDGYKSLRTARDKKYLLTLQPFKVWIKYYNIKTNQFRTGGLLSKVDPDLRYIMLVNTRFNLTWSVQLDDNIIFVPDPKIALEKERLKQEEIKQQKKIEKTKDKLYELYLKGKLARTD